MARTRNARRIDGVLLLDKPLGPSSNSVLQHVKRLFEAQRAGHTGTLDPRATGLLPICLGEATKFGSQLLDADKAYVADVRLGIRTATGDAEGLIIEERPVDVSKAQLDSALAAFRGEINQVPPMHSALKKDGQPLYKLARVGVEVERKARQVNIRRLEATTLEGNMLQIFVRCSKGTYIRTLAEDIGESLGCGAHLASLRRVETGNLSLERATSLERLESLDLARRTELLLPVDTLVAELPRIELGVVAAQRFQQGQETDIPDQCLQPTNGQVRVYGSLGRFLGLGLVVPGKRLQPHRLMSVSNG